jgi:hypothetical protein
VSFTTAPVSPGTFGSPVSVTPTPTGGGTVEYQLSVYDFNNTAAGYVLVNDWQTTSPLTWDTSVVGSGAGRYALRVRARNVGSGVPYEAQAFDYFYNLN